MKKRMFLLTVFFALLAMSLSAQSGKKFYKAGSEFADNQKYDDAVVQFTSAIGAEPSNDDYYFQRGLAYEKSNKISEAYADFEKAIVFKPKEVKYIVALGRACNKMGKYDEALVLLNRASGLEKRNGSIYPEKAITLISLKKYDQALTVSDTANLIKDEAINYYHRGLCFVRLFNDIKAEKELEKAISKDKKYVDPRLEIADLYIRINKLTDATEQVNTVLEKDDKNTQAYLVRSKIYKKNLDYPNALNDVSKAILIDPSNPDYYFIRGTYYQEFNQHPYAIADFSKYISLKPGDPDAYYARARSYEEIREGEKAIEDYNKITEISEFDPKARKMLKDAQVRLFELNREKVAPEITVIAPSVTPDNEVFIKGNSNSITISGKIKEKNKINALTINNQNVTYSEKKNGESEFFTPVDVTGKDQLSLVARDEYNNEKVLNLKIIRTEITPPTVILVAPLVSSDNVIYLEDKKPSLYLEGKITDESKLKSIEVAGVSASYRKDQIDPGFSATIDISNLNRFTVIAEDIYGNRQETEFTLNRENAGLSESNPMGKTWVVFIENSSYETFNALDGPIKDVSTIQRALANYQISHFEHKKDMTKTDMEKYFNIELRDLLKANQVKSLLVWYAGHGKFINDVGYWIPVDAKRDDEFTYFNINVLKANMQAYTGLVHTLVISDACESGPSFYQAMRSSPEEKTCDNVMATAMRSAQVFTSAQRQLATDNSQFTQTFANTLLNNNNACVPIDKIVKTVTDAVAKDNQQKPKFGQISGLVDEGGTFFFIAK
jgi:tetratricopeptide (TPR) repeat protein